MDVFICRDASQVILGVFSKRADAETSFRDCCPKVVFNGICVVDKGKQIGWLTSHKVETEPRGDFRQYSVTLP